MRKSVVIIPAILIWCAAATCTAASGDGGEPHASKGRASAFSPAERLQMLGDLRAMRAQVAELEKRVAALEGRLGAAGASAPPPGVTPAGAAPPGVTPPGVAPPGETTVGSALKRLLPGPVSPPSQAYVGGRPEGVIVSGLEGVPKVFIPDIGGIGDFTLRQSDIRRGDPRFDAADDKFRVRDTQLVFFSPIDPYTLAQISIDKPDRGPFDIEEAFLVFNKLPYDLTLRAGQYRPRFGLLNQLDTFQLPFVNRPNALANYIGPDGLVEPGVNLTAYIPNPWEADLKADFNMVSGNNLQSFDHRAGNTFDFAYIGTLAYSRDVFTSGSMTTGASFAGGPGPGGQAYLEDGFMQVRYIPSQRHALTWDVEGLLAERKGVGDHGVKRGVYSLLDYNFWLRYHAGILLDLADRPAVARGTELGISPVFTYFVSDNTRLRLQYTHTTASGPERADNLVFVQATFTLGNLKPLQ